MSMADGEADESPNGARWIPPGYHRQACANERLVYRFAEVPKIRGAGIALSIKKQKEQTRNTARDRFPAEDEDAAESIPDGE